MLSYIFQIKSILNIFSNIWIRKYVLATGTILLLCWIPSILLAINGHWYQISWFILHVLAIIVWRQTLIVFRWTKWRLVAKLSSALTHISCSLSPIWISAIDFIGIFAWNRCSNLASWWWPLTGSAPRAQSRPPQPEHACRCHDS